MGSYRSQPDKVKFTMSQTTTDIEFALAQMCGWRLYLQDTAIQSLNFDQLNNHIFGIFDGHGGAQVAIYIKDHFVQQLLKNHHYRTKQYKEALEQTFQNIDKLLKTVQGKRQIQKIQRKLILEDNLPKRDCKQCAGSTALVCLLCQNQFIVANAGDSQAYVKKNGSFNNLNNIHLPSLPQQKQRIQNAGGFVDQDDRINGCLNVSRAIGDLQFKKNKRLPQRKQMIISLPQIRRQSLQGVDYILMGSDGIWQGQSAREIEKFIDERMQRGVDLRKILQELFEWLVCKQDQIQEKQQGKDNMTAILIKFNHHPKSHQIIYEQITSQQQQVIQF